MNDGHLVVAYHGCDITTRDDLVAGRTQPKSSDNKYDWLGPGFYLFEGDRERAAAFAAAAAADPSRLLTAQPIAEPAVVGCIFTLQRCLDMTTRQGLFEFEQARERFDQSMEEKKTGKPAPVNVPPKQPGEDVLLRHYDSAVINFLHTARDDESKDGYHYQAVRGAFRQGAELAPNSGFHKDSHIQIALRDFSCIVGWFLPTGARLLSEYKYKKAKQNLDVLAKKNPKRRVRAAPG